MLNPLIALVLLAQTPDESARLADAAVQERNYDEAIVILNKAVAVNPKWRAGWWRLASVFYDTENYAAARPAFEQMIELDPKPGAPWVLLGLCEFQLKDYTLALQHLQRGDALGLASEPDLLGVARYHQALLLILAGKFDIAQILLDQLSRNGDSAEAVTFAQGLAALRISGLPDSVDDSTGLIHSVGAIQYAVAQRKIKEALESYKELIARSPSMPNLHLSFAALLVQMNDLKAAENEMRTELKLYPQSVEARLRLCALLEEGSPNEMVSIAKEAVDLDPKSFKTHFHLGRLLYKIEKFNESAKELEISRDLDPSSSMVRFALIRAYKALGKQSEARQEAEAFQRLRTAEEEFRTTGHLPLSFFETH